METVEPHVPAADHKIKGRSIREVFAIPPKFVEISNPKIMNQEDLMMCEILTVKSDDAIEIEWMMKYANAA